MKKRIFLAVITVIITMAANTYIDNKEVAYDVDNKR